MKEKFSNVYIILRVTSGICAENKMAGRKPILYISSIQYVLRFTGKVINLC